MPDSAVAGIGATVGRMSFGHLADAVSEEWLAWRQRVDLDEYDARWERLAATGQATHGEADLIELLGGPGAAVLDAGCGMGRVAIELARRQCDVVGVDLDGDLLERARRRAPTMTWVHDDLATMQLDRRFDVAAMPGNVMIFCRVEDRRSIIHNLVQHLEPGGLLVAGFSLDRQPRGLSLAEYDAIAADCELTLVQRWSTWDRQPFGDGDYAVSVHRRTERFTVHDLVVEARRSIERVTPGQLSEMLGGDRRPIVVDTRSHVDRDRFGVIRNSIHVPRTVAEWQLDPANGFPHPEIGSLDQPLVVVCNGGYSSSLTAANLVRLGYSAVSDMVGGVAAWRRAGLPLVAPDHSHLDY